MSNLGYLNLTTKYWAKTVISDALKEEHNEQVQLGQINQQHLYHHDYNDIEAHEIQEAAKQAKAYRSSVENEICALEGEI